MFTLPGLASSWPWVPQDDQTKFVARGVLYGLVDGQVRPLLTAEPGEQPAALYARHVALAAKSA